MSLRIFHSFLIALLMVGISSACESKKKVVTAQKATTFALDGKSRKALREGSYILNLSEYTPPKGGYAELLVTLVDKEGKTTVNRRELQRIGIFPGGAFTAKNVGEAKKFRVTAKELPTNFDHIEVSLVVRSGKADDARAKVYLTAKRLAPKR